MLRGVDITPLLSQIKVPTLVLAPARSPITPLTDQLTLRYVFLRTLLATALGLPDAPCSLKARKLLCTLSSPVRLTIP